MADTPTCEYCDEPIEPPDEPVRMAKQVNVTAMNPAGQRQWTDGKISTFHPYHAPSPQVGVWRRVTE